ncbi:hypothetical protein ACHAPE_004673 [Trichoderma viride]
MTEDQAVELAKALKIVINELDKQVEKGRLQVLWKLRKHRQAAASVFMDTRTHEQPEEATLEVKMPNRMDTTYAHITSYLRQLQGSIDDETKPYVFPKLLSYINAKDASLWRDVYDIDCVGGELCAAVSVFWVVRKHNKKAWLGCAVMPPTSWVGVPWTMDGQDHVPPSAPVV